MLIRAIRGAAVAAAALVLAGCSHPAHQNMTSPSTTSRRLMAPVTFTHHPPSSSSATAPAPPDPSTTPSPAGSSSSAPPAAASNPGSAAGWTEPGTPAENLGGPANAREITAPRYDLDWIDRGSAEQVAWAYLVSLMSYSYGDPGPGVGAARAATFAVPVKNAPARTTGSVSTSAAWANVVANQMVSRAAVTELTAYVPGSSKAGAQASIHLSWVSTLTQRGGAIQRISGQTTMLEVRQADGKWLVSDNGFGTPD